MLHCILAWDNQFRREWKEEGGNCIQIRIRGGSGEDYDLGAARRGQNVMNVQLPQLGSNCLEVFIDLSRERSSRCGILG